MSTIWKTPEKVVQLLLVRVRMAKELPLADHNDDIRSLASKFEDAESTLQQMQSSLLQIKNWETMVVEQLGVLDQVLDDEIFSVENASRSVGDRLKRIEAGFGKLKSLVPKVEYQYSVSPPPGGTNSMNNNGQSIAGETADHDHVEEDEVSKNKTMSFISDCFHCLGSSQLKTCLVFFAVFPENKAIKKRPLIYWWIGEGLITNSRNATAEEVGEQFFQELLNHSIIKHITSNTFTVYPWIREVLMELAKKNRLLDFSRDETPRSAYGRAFLWRSRHAMDIDGKEEDVVAVYNMNKQYLGSSPDWLSRTRKLKVLQMGRWQDSTTHHIEAEDYEKLFERLGSQKHLKYLSLRGISRVETLPQSIGKLTSLLILDLRACHNLNKLPEEVAQLRSLTHLDVSECYLMDSMPKELQRLSDLQVLKGFVVSNSNSKSCNINDLAQLQYLRKLSVRVGNEQQLGSLAGFGALRILTISWGVVKSNAESTVASLPKSLVKLDLRSVPFKKVPEWMHPSELLDLEKLYIKGGELTTLSQHVYQKLKFLRLNYLKDLHINEQDNLDDLYPNCEKQITKCRDHDPDSFLTRAGYTS